MERTISFTKDAAKALVRMPANDAKRVRAKINLFASDPEALANNVTALKGSALVRLRVGDYRVIMDADTLTVQVIAIGVRGGIYE
jgi:mRNA interferase RelE/StbE